MHDVGNGCIELIEILVVTMVVTRVARNIGEGGGVERHCQEALSQWAHFHISTLTETGWAIVSPCRE